MALITLSERDIATRIAAEQNLELSQVTGILQRFFDYTGEAVCTGIAVRCRNFGTFSPKMRRQFVFVRFKQAKVLRAQVQQLIRDG